MQDGCEECARIAARETALDARAAAFDAKINERCADVRAANKTRWEDHAWRCSLPIVGGLYFRRRPNPALLPEPEYREEDWFLAECKGIHADYEAIETAKQAHLDHFLFEVVKPNANDPAGYFSPEYCTRLQCRNQGWGVMVPDKYDYRSLAGTDKLQEGAYVMDADSKRIVPRRHCNWEWISGFGVLYYYRGSAA